jgi:hypothetical protein
MMLENPKSLLAISLLLVLTSCLNGGGGGSDVATASSASSTPAPATPGPAVLSATITSISQGAIDNLVTVNVSGVNPFSVGSVVSITGTAAYNRAAPLAYTIVSVTPSSFVIAVAEVGDETPVAATAQGGGGVVAACSTTVTAGAAGQITLSHTPSRYSGVAPLGVFFDATATTAIAAPSKPFHDLDYTWTFGDGGSGNWANGARAGSSRNAGKGPVTAHVFETPGLYTVNLSVSDGTNTVANNCVQIAVQEPDVIFSGTNTICISNAGATQGVGGCPANAATPVGTGVFNTALASCTTGKRCLFKGGDTFVSLATADLTTAGPITIGAYGGGSAIVTSNDIGVLRFSNNAVSDIRIMDLDIAGGGAADTSTCLSVGTLPTPNVTILRLSCHDIGKGIIMVSGASITGSVIQDSHIYNINAASGGVGIFGWAINSAYLGNLIGPFAGTAEHNVRLQPGQKVAIAHNTISTPGNTGKTNLTVRALEHITPNGVDNSFPAGTAQADTQYIYISDNKLVGGAGASVQMFQIGPASNSQNNWISDVVAERNWIVFGSTAQQGQFGTSVRLTVRNNICDATGGAANRTCFGNDYTNTAGVPVPDDNRFYGNTCYAGDISASFTCIGLGGTNPTTNNVVKNNLAYAPGPVNPRLLNSGGGVVGTIGASGSFGNSSNAQVKATDPLWLNASGLFNTPLDFKPGGASYAIGTNNACATLPCSVSTGVPVWSDFFLVSQPATRDMGAVIH